MADYFNCGESHGGIRIAELLRKTSGMTHGVFAKRLGVSSYRLRSLLKGTKAIDMDIALKLSCIFPEHTARDWLEIQTAYELHQAYASGKMDSIAREMGAENRNVSRTDYIMSFSNKAHIVKVPLRYPLDCMMNALCEKLDMPPQDVAMEAIRQLWKEMDQEKN
jgi:Plasmid maintenance system antidote protein